MKSKSIALPLGYIPMLGRNMGIEPMHAGSTNRCVNHFTNSAIDLFDNNIKTGIVGIEPTLAVLETDVLPLYDIPILWRPVDSNHRTQRERFYRPPRLATSLGLQNGARRNRTADTRSFNPLLYQLSYRAIVRSLPESNRWSPPWQGGVITATLRDQIAGIGFEPMTFGLWARRAARLLHPAITLI